MIKTTDFSGNVQVIEYSVYPGGEITLATRVNEFDIEEIFAHITSADDLMALCQVSDIILKFSPNAFLTLPYVPYARQDRVIDDTIGGQCLSIKVFANIINSLAFKSVMVYDAHSDVSTALINNCYNISKEDIFEDLLMTRYNNAVLLAPDQGAIKSVEKLANKCRLENTFAIKKRDPATGMIKYRSIVDSHLLNDREVIVVDDICDGGATFVALAEMINNHDIKPKSLKLFVTHGIFSKGLTPLLDAGYDEVVSRFAFPKHRDNFSMDKFESYSYDTNIKTAYLSTK